MTDLDRQAAVAADRLMATMGKSLDVQTVRRFVAAHIGLNPHVTEPLDPDAKLLASNAKLSAMVADLRQRLADATQAKAAAEQAVKLLRGELAAAKHTIESLAKGHAITPRKRKKQRKLKPQAALDQESRAKRAKHAAKMRRLRTKWQNEARWQREYADIGSALDQLHAADR